MAKIARRTTYAVGAVLIAAVMAVIAGIRVHAADRASSSDCVKYRTVRDELARAQAALSTKDYLGASRAANNGLANLGGHYFDKPLLDDSGLHLVAANISEKRGDMSGAAKERTSILAERLKLYRESRSCPL
jgi:hypothetical protein